MENEARISTRRKNFLLLNSILLVTGSCGGSLITRLYFVNGGNRVWLSSFLQTAGFPVILVPLVLAYSCCKRRRTTFIKPRVFLSSMIIGVLAGGSNFFSTYCFPRLPTSTASLIGATQLAFAVMFAFLVVKQKFTAYSVNAVVLLTVAAMALGIDAPAVRTVTASVKEYALGFCLMVAGTALSGFMLPLVELMYKKAKQVLSYTSVMEIHMAVCTSASALCIVGMLINNDFQAISREAKQYELGEFKYYLVLVCSGIVHQCFFLGCIGVIFYASALLAGIIITASIPITQLMAVAFYQDKLQPDQGFAVFLSLWGFLFYFYGEMKHSKKAMEGGDHDHHQESRTREMTFPDIEAW